MEKEIEKILNSIYYLTIKVDFIEFGKYRIKIDELDKWLTYKLDYKGNNLNQNIKIITEMIDNEIIKSYRKEV